MQFDKIRFINKAGVVGNNFKRATGGLLGRITGGYIFE